MVTIHIYIYILIYLYMYTHTYMHMRMSGWIDGRMVGWMDWREREYDRWGGGKEGRGKERREKEGKQMEERKGRRGKSVCTMWMQKPKHCLNLTSCHKIFSYLTVIYFLNPLFPFQYFNKHNPKGEAAKTYTSSKIVLALLSRLNDFSCFMNN